MLKKPLLAICLGLALGPLGYVQADTTTAAAPNDAHALQGVKTGKVVFDINIPGDAKKMALYLQVIKQTFEDLQRQNVKPDMILAFRGLAVKLISTQQPDDLPLDHEEALSQVAEIIAELQAKGVRVEACTVATTLFNVPHDSLLPGVVPVGNTFVSLTGYHAQGYASIPIY